MIVRTVSAVERADIVIIVFDARKLLRASFEIQSETPTKYSLEIARRYFFLSFNISADLSIKYAGVSKNRFGHFPHLSNHLEQTAAV